MPLDGCCYILMASYFVDSSCSVKCYSLLRFSLLCWFVVVCLFRSYAKTSWSSLGCSFRDGVVRRMWAGWFAVAWLSLSWRLSVTKNAGYQRMLEIVLVEIMSHCMQSSVSKRNEMELSQQTLMKWDREMTRRNCTAATWLLSRYSEEERAWSQTWEAISDSCWIPKNGPWKWYLLLGVSRDRRKAWTQINHNVFHSRHLERSWRATHTMETICYNVSSVKHL